MYVSKLNLIETEKALKEIKHVFELELSQALNLTRISAPLFVAENSGLNDNLNGVERPVSFDIKATGETAEVVHSLAKWKRYALAKYRFGAYFGLYTDMNAIRIPSTSTSGIGRRSSCARTGRSNTSKIPSKRFTRRFKRPPRTCAANTPCWTIIFPKR